MTVINNYIGGSDSFLQEEVDLFLSSDLKNNFTALDPAFWARKFNLLYPGAIDKYAVLDSGRMQKLVNDVLNNDSGAPVWLPDGADLHIGFKNGQYWSNGTEVTLASLVGDDALMSITFNPNDVVVGVGLVGPAGLIGDASMVLNQECTILVIGSNETGKNTVLEFTEETFASDVNFRLTTSGASPGISDSGGGSLQLPGQAFLPLGAFKGTFTKTPTVMFGAIGGVTLEEPGEPSIKEFDPSLPVPFTSNTTVGNGVIETITIWLTIKNATQLQALTAP